MSQAVQQLPRKGYTTMNQDKILNTIESTLYPTVKDLAKQSTGSDSAKSVIKAGFLTRTDAMPVDETILNLAKRIPAPALQIVAPILVEHPELLGQDATQGTLSDDGVVATQNTQTGGYELLNPKGSDLMEYHLLSRLLSVTDLSPNVYDIFAANKTAMSNWWPQIKAAVSKQTFFKVPRTKVHTLPIELAQYIRIPWQKTSQIDRDKFNAYIFKTFDLLDDATYFIKTGTFSSKFQFANAKCSEPREMGDYFHVINNFAMKVGAGQTVDLVVREYIHDSDHRPTIYNGMPLRTEFRAFIDFDKHCLFGTVPYWHPSVMEKGLTNPFVADTIEKDFVTYLGIKDTLIADFNANIDQVNQHLIDIIPMIDLHGCYSVDIMKNGNDFYIIDMALAATSALCELLPDYPVRLPQTPVAGNVDKLN